MPSMRLPCDFTQSSLHLGGCHTRLPRLRCTELILVRAGGVQGPGVCGVLVTIIAIPTSWAGCGYNQTETGTGLARVTGLRLVVPMTAQRIGGPGCEWLTSSLIGLLPAVSSGTTGWMAGNGVASLRTPPNISTRAGGSNTTTYPVDSISGGRRSQDLVRFALQVDPMLHQAQSIRWVSRSYSPRPGVMR